MSSDGISTTATAAGWAIIIGLGGAAYYLSENKGVAATAPTKKTAAHQPEPRKEKAAKSKTKRRDAFLSDVQEAATAVKATGLDAKEAIENKWLSNSGGDDDEAASNKEFARQLANVREGTKFNNKSSGEKKRQKSVKQSSAQVASFEEAEKVSAPSSTAGADGDDDQSSTTSPVVKAADAGGFGVDDMLEPAPAGPSILRIVDTDKVKQQTKKAAKAPEPAETKKQRQNRKKRENEKALRDEAEQERKKLEEQQRRTARVARGESAKDGSQFMARVNGNKPSVWTGDAPAGKAASSNASDSNGFVPVQPLDTFDHQQAPSKPVKTQPKESAKPLSDSWISDLPSEEEQLKKLTEGEDSWNTVKTKSTKRAPKKEDEKTEAPAAAPQTASKPAAAARPTAAPIAAKGLNGSAAKSAQSYGSYSALSTTEVDEKETEWEL